jgi:hypothetical protein
MNFHARPEVDLMPPPFAEGLDDWTWGEGMPDGPSYDEADFARVAPRDLVFGTCLELRTVEPVQRLRYMGELPVARGAFLEVTAALKVVRGPLPKARIAAWPGGARGLGVAGLPMQGPLETFAGHDRVRELRAVIGPAALPCVDLVWDERVLYTHVGLDLVGEAGAVVRVSGIAVREVTGDFTGRRLLPGFFEPIRN